MRITYRIEGGGCRFLEDPHAWGVRVCSIPQDKVVTSAAIPGQQPGVVDEIDLADIRGLLVLIYGGQTKAYEEIETE